MRAKPKRSQEAKNKETKKQEPKNQREGKIVRHQCNERIVIG